MTDTTTDTKTNGKAHGQADTTAYTAAEMGPFCQSCGMPLHRPEDFGTSAEGFRVNDYCSFCFGDGVFTEPSLTMRQMMEKCVPAMAEAGMPEVQARGLMEAIMPKLKRWRGPSTAP